MSDQADIYAVVTDGVVTNVIRWDGVQPWSPPQGSAAVRIPDGTAAGIGWDYLDGQFVDNRPAEVVPVEHL